MYILALNGPPRCGKDTVGNQVIRILAERSYYAEKVKLAAPLRRTAMSFLAIPDIDEVYEGYKDQSTTLGVTLRKFMIDLSEEFIKPTYGIESFCRLAWNEIALNDLYPNFMPVITDIGFPHESKFFEQRVGAENFLLIQLDRHGSTFAGDSRGWIEATNFEIVDNNTTPEWAAQQIVAKMVNLGWGI